MFHFHVITFIIIIFLILHIYATALSEVLTLVDSLSLVSQVTKIGLIVHKTQDNHFQMLAGSAGFFLQSLSVGKI